MSETNMLATIMLNDQQAHLIRMRFHTSKGWSELAEIFPKFVEALELLPDISGLLLCNPMLQDMVWDTIKLYGFERKELKR